MRRYYLHTRYDGIFYAELVTENGVKLSARSTGTKNRDEALMVISAWFKEGIPMGKRCKRLPLETAAAFPDIIKAVKKADIDAEEAMRIVSALRERDLIDFGVTKAGPGRERFIPFLLRFWDRENSPYLKDKFAHGHSMTKKYCRNMGQIIERHWRPYFEDAALNGVSQQSLREFSLSLRDKGLASATVNNIMIAGTKALRWAFTEGLIPVDPTAGLTGFTGEGEGRDILTEEEIETLFYVVWQDKRAYAAALLSLTTGIRSGEVRAIRKDDIGGAVLDVSHSWNDTEGLKRPKNGEPRKVPLLPEVRGLLLELLEETPHRSSEQIFVFYSGNPDKPCSAMLFLRGLRRAIRAAGIDIAGRKIDFHSFRHISASRMADRMAADKVAKVTGHRSKAAAKVYQDHVTGRILAEAGVEAAKEFGNILPFSGKKNTA
jgi:integrase